LLPSSVIKSNLEDFLDSPDAARVEEIIAAHTGESVGEGAPSGAVSGVNGLINGVNKVTGAVGIPAIPTFTAPQIPMLATGGVIRTRGTVIVGEKGPEMLSLPRGAQVTPLANKPMQKTENHFHISIYADGKSVEDIIDELIPKLKLALSNL